MLKKNIVNPKYRKWIWFFVSTIVIASWISTAIKVVDARNGVSFVHFDQELAISCVLEQGYLSVDWICKKNKPVNFIDFDPSPKYWTYNTEDGEIVVERRINLGEVIVEVSHPELGEPFVSKLD